MSDVTNQAVFSTAKWIWVEDKQQKNDLCIFRKAFTLENKPRRIYARIAVDTHYFLNINGKFVVWQGGINHSAGEDCKGYYDEIEVGKYIKKGENSVVIICRYFGNTGNDSIDKGQAGLIAEFTSGEGNVIFATNSEFEACRNLANKEAAGKVSVKYAGFSFAYDATAEQQLTGLYLPTYKSSVFAPSKELCAYGEQPFGELKKRTIPQYLFNEKLKFGKKEKRDKDASTAIYSIKLPRAMYVYPALVAKALSMEKIKIYTERTEAEGDFGDKSVYVAPHIEYVCKSAKQTFESFAPLYGQEIFFEAPKTVKIAKLGYRFVEYASAEKGAFACNDAQISLLAPKCINTLKACLTDRIINNPERDRATTLDSLNISVRALLKIFDKEILCIVRKTIADVFNNIGNDGTIYSNVPSTTPIEIPSAGLLTVSEQGMFAAYSNYFSDMDANFLAATVDYLKKWELKDGLIVPRGGWMDNLFNIDSEVLENCLYYSGLKFAKRLALKTANNEFDDFIDPALEGFGEAFHKRFFNGLGYSSHPDYNDDRANAFAVLTGLCDKKNYGLLSELIVSTQNASPYLEGYVIEALCVMDKNKFARNRMSSRYAEMNESKSTTLGEEFCLGGTQTSSRSVMPLSVLIEYFGGVKVSDGGNKITITPDLGDLQNLSFACVTPKGVVKGEYARNKDGALDFVIHNDSKTEASVIIKARGEHSEKTYKLTKGKCKYTQA